MGQDLNPGPRDPDPWPITTTLSSYCFNKPNEETEAEMGSYSLNISQVVNLRASLKSLSLTPGPALHPALGFDRLLPVGLPNQNQSLWPPSLLHPKSQQAPGTLEFPSKHLQMKACQCPHSPNLTDICLLRLNLDATILGSVFDPTGLLRCPMWAPSTQCCRTHRTQHPTSQLPLSRSIAPSTWKLLKGREWM